MVNDGVGMAQATLFFAAFGNGSVLDFTCVCV